MTKRKIIVKTGTYISNTFPLNNGIPQGFLISVILLLTAYSPYQHHLYPQTY